MFSNKKSYSRKSPRVERMSKESIQAIKNRRTLSSAHLEEFYKKRNRSIEIHFKKNNTVIDDLLEKVHKDRASRDNSALDRPAKVSSSYRVANLSILLQNARQNSASVHSSYSMARQGSQSQRNLNNSILMRSIDTVVKPLTSTTIKSYRTAERNLKKFRLQPKENSIKDFSNFKDSLSSSKGLAKKIREKIYGSAMLPRIKGDYNGVRYRQAIDDEVEEEEINFEKKTNQEILNIIRHRGESGVDSKEIKLFFRKNVIKDFIQLDRELIKVVDIKGLDKWVDQPDYAKTIDN